jgi:hypothetical protein
VCYEQTVLARANYWKEEYSKGQNRSAGITRSHHTEPNHGCVRPRVTDLRRARILATTLLTDDV